ncbi:MAG: Lipid-A-disaccharide synthase, partial [Chlamydiae bacterium]|nr:Lipid-A-disaccharide synthase [Chlamydiota bacterium]
MIPDSLRTLLYPLGLIASILFTLRFMVQWIRSERKKESHVTSIFWVFSLIGNTILATHALFQLQYPLALIQTINAVISWRNLNLMSSHSRSFRWTLTTMILGAGMITLLFFAQGTTEWMRPPTMPWTGEHAPHASLPWHLLGFAGMIFFASRFWIQWWQAEQHKKSSLSPAFWWISLIGGTLSTLYFLRLHDLVNILGYSTGLIPYLRNLMLLKQTKTAPKTQNNIYFVAGEQSGDLLGEKLIKALQEGEYYGVGGKEMRAAGLKCNLPMEKLQTMGFIEVIKAAPRLFATFRKIKREILELQPKGVVFIDYPDFNMRLAKALRKKGYTGKLIHYVCPSVWAWRKARIKDLTQTLDLLLTILPFEKNCFSHTQLPVTYIGHPLVAAIDHHAYDPDWNPEGKKYLSIFPGSRPSEIALNLPLQLQAAKPFADELPLAISVAHPDLEQPIREILAKTVLKATLVPNHHRYELMRDSHVALA